MAKKFVDLRAQMTPESQARAEAKAQAMLAEAMGGQLEVVARFPDGAVKISNFSDLGRGAGV